MADLKFRGQQITLKLSNKAVLAKAPFYFTAHVTLKSLLFSCLPRNCSRYDNRADRHTHRPSTVTLTAHAH